MRWPWSKKTIPKLVWLAQYLSRDPAKDGNALIHFAKSAWGYFEIYEDDENNGFLVSYPRLLRLPADVFDSLCDAKSHCNNINSKEPKA